MARPRKSGCRRQEGEAGGNQVQSEGEAPRRALHEPIALT